MSGWLKEHGSAVFIAVIFIVTLLFFFGGLQLTESATADVPQPNPMLHGLGVILINLSGVGVAAGVTTLFFGFADVKSHMSSSVARLFSDASVVTLLGSDVKRRLRQRLSEDAVSGIVVEVNQSLFRHLQEVVDGSLGTVYVANHNTATTISPSKTPGCFRMHDVTTFRIHSGHLKSAAAFPLKYFLEITVPKDHGIAEADLVESAVLVVGDQKFGRNDIRITPVAETAGTIKYSAVFERVIPLTAAETDCRYEIVSMASSVDPTISVCARYATTGFTVTLVRDEAHDFDAAWFTYCAPEENLPPKGFVNRLPNGLSVRTNEWVLPGEGVTISHWPRHTQPDGQSRAGSGP